MEAQHTPGKWIKTLNRIENEAGEEIARVSYRRSGYVQANARLIAAAPELLEALKRIGNYLSIHNPDYWDANADAVKARAAIAKAERNATITVLDEGTDKLETCTGAARCAGRR